MSNEDAMGLTNCEKAMMVIMMIGYIHDRDGRYDICDDWLHEFHVTSWKQEMILPVGWCLSDLKTNHERTDRVNKKSNVELNDFKPKASSEEIA